ncbi:hypothetical protein [Phocicoccus pinnipedialis]|uniref:Uncharacterized protein n=1 Tax=Phocicoccus pinnipedialis TaxID=110845 RepID=A0A6V7R8R4_9BACL|nr:hypothetical protein [Jeotgalicoccus pinnipedialis]MBP1940149.1 hypothetical protein [Jeotgalicoccus pinnipedialis]CAD2073751.1 hypothetical protein JEOPIN946_00731 [Jeotgalicoccus pinnipedialis]
MDKNKKQAFVIDKTNEPRKDAISNMIDEGGLGAEKYYVIKKNHKSRNDHASNILSNKDPNIETEHL